VISYRVTNSGTTLEVMPFVLSSERRDSRLGLVPGPSRLASRLSFSFGLVSISVPPISSPTLGVSTGMERAATTTVEAILAEKSQDQKTFKSLP